MPESTVSSFEEDGYIIWGMRKGYEAMHERYWSVHRVEPLKRDEMEAAVIEDEGDNSRTIAVFRDDGDAQLFAYLKSGDLPIMSQPEQVAPSRTAVQQLTVPVMRSKAFEDKLIKFLQTQDSLILRSKIKPYV